MIRRSFPLIGSTIRQVHVGRQMHRLPDEIVVASLEKHLNALFPKGWYACVLFSDGRGTLRSDERKSPPPPIDAAERLLDVCTELNRNVDHNGHWVGVWSMGRMSLLWRDGDGDAQFTVDLDEPWARARAWTVLEIADRAEAGFEAWVERMRAVDRKGSETIKAAQGEQSRGFLTLH